MSKDVLIAGVLVLLGLITWATLDFVHGARTSDLPAGIENYLTPINPNISLDRE